MSVYRALVESLADRNTVVRVTAIEELGRTRTSRALHAILGALDDRSPEVRARAVEVVSRAYAVSQKDRSAVIKALTKRLQDRDPLVRIAAAESLAYLRDRRALPFLWRTSTDRSPLVRAYVYRAIGTLAESGAISRLRRIALKDKAKHARVGLIEALYTLGDPTGLMELGDLLKSEDYRIRCAVANAMGALPLTKSDAEAVRQVLRQALSNEPTIAARSSIGNSLRALSRRVGANNAEKY